MAALPFPLGRQVDIDIEVPGIKGGQCIFKAR